MTRRTLGIALLATLGLIATQGAAMAETPSEPDPKDPKKSKVGGEEAPEKRPF